MTSRPILLFKEPSPDNEYENMLQEKGYEAKCIPVLQTTTTNTDLLLEYLVNAEIHDLRGVVITSKRSCDSLAEALAKLCSQSSEDAIPALGWLLSDSAIHEEHS
jgi:uroporphyrinogen-III synthase